MMREASIIQDWIQDGKAAEARHMLLRLLHARFGELPDTVVSRFESEEPEWCEELAVRTLEAKLLAELGL